jgi:hypothetical protein
MPVIVDCELSNSMGGSFLYASSSSASQISRTLRKALVHCCIGNRLPLVPNQCQTSPVHAFPDDLSSLIISLSCLRLGLPRGPFRSGIKTMYVLLPTIRATCPAHLTLITRIIFGDQSTSRHSSLRHCLQCPAKFSFLGRNIFLSTMFSSNPKSVFFRQCEKPRSHPYKTRNENIFSRILIFVCLHSKLKPEKFQIFELSHSFEPFITSVCDVI